MMMFDKNRALSTLMKRRGGAGPDVGPAPMKQEKVMDEGGEVDGRHLAAQDAMAAIHEKSPMKFMEAMMNFHDLHMAKREEGDVPVGPKDSGN